MRHLASSPPCPLSASDLDNMKKSPYPVGVAMVIALGFAATTFAIARFAWADWTLYAVIVTAFVVLGGVRYWPWGTAWAKPAGAGIVIGLFIAAAEFVALNVH